MEVRVESPEVIDSAIEVLEDGGLVVVSTRTNYCLVCDPLNKEAVERVFEAKQRTKFGPLTLALHEAEAAGEYVSFPDGFDEQILSEIWPSEVSFIFDKDYPFPDRLTNGASTIALMFHDPCGLQRLLTKLGRPLGLTSANLSGQGDIRIDIAKTTSDLGDAVDLIIEAPTNDEITISSTSQEHPSNTIVDLTMGRPYLLRPGVLPVSELQRYFPDLETDIEIYKKLLQERLAGSR